MALALDPVTPSTDLVPEFSSLHERVTATLAPAIALGFDDRGLAVAAVERALTRAGQRWQRHGNQADAMQLVHRDAFAWAMTSRWPRKLPERPGPNVIPVAPPGVQATASTPAGEGERKEASATVPLLEGLRLLPIRQRNALICRYHLAWSAAATAAAHDVEPSTIELRVSRGLEELGRSTGLDQVDLVEQLPDVIAQAVPALPELSGADAARNRARGRTFRTRATVLGAGLLVIVAVAAVIRAAPAEQTDQDTGIETVDPPRESQAPFAPVGDGRGGFIALSRRAGVISSSADGIDWVATGRLNVDRIDLRLFVERIFRSDGRYVALVDSTNGGGISLSGTDVPRIAISQDLSAWTLHTLNVGELPQVEGLKPSINLLNAAVVGDRVLVAVSIEQDVDYRARGLRRADVCTIANDQAGLILHLCNGDSMPLASPESRSQAGLENTFRLYASDGGAAFQPVPIDDQFHPWGLFSFDGQFGMLTESTEELFVSPDGVAWEPLFNLGIDNRLGLVAPRAESTTVISPTAGRWLSHVLQDGQVIAGELPVTIDPTSIWLKPEFVSGPAGWALFVTASRPWERRGDDAVAWAVHIDDWVIEQRAGAGSIRLRSTTGSRSYEFTSLQAESLPGAHPTVERGQFGGVRLYEPQTGELLVDVTGAQVRESWVTGEESGAPVEGRLEVGEWTVTGNMRTGPIELTRPDGSTTSWDDGFALTNGETSDGIESSLLDDPTDGTLQFFDPQGELELQVTGLELAPLDPEPPATANGEVKAFVVFSPDGVNWETIWETTSNTWYGSIAVGDDEVLVSATGIAAEAERVPVGQTD